jgi:hypothetical protein
MSGDHLHSNGRLTPLPHFYPTVTIPNGVLDKVISRIQIENRCCEVSLSHDFPIQASSLGYRLPAVANKDVPPEIFCRQKEQWVT